MSDASKPYLPRASDDLSDRLLWIWRRGRLDVQRGADHGKNLRWPAPSREDPGVEGCYRGWFDPMRGEMFVVRPRHRATAAGNIRSIPAALDRALHRRFGDGFRYLLF